MRLGYPVLRHCTSLTRASFNEAEAHAPRILLSAVIIEPVLRSFNEAEAHAPRILSSGEFVLRAAAVLQ